MTISYFRKSSENTQNLFSLMQELPARPRGKDLKGLTVQHSYQIPFWPGYWEVKEQALGELTVLVYLIISSKVSCWLVARLFIYCFFPEIIHHGV